MSCDYCRYKEISTACPRCGAKPDATSEFVDASGRCMLTVMITCIKFPLIHLPAFLPAALFTAFLTGRVYSLFLDPGWILGFFAIMTLIASTQLFWELFSKWHGEMKKKQGAVRKTLYALFYGYIVVCYGTAAYYIAKEFEASTQTIVWVVLGSVVMGLANSFYQMRQAAEGKDLF